MMDFGVTTTSTPQFCFYAAFMSAAAAGYGHVEGNFVGIGGGDIGAMRIYYNHYGVFVYGREMTGWGNSIWSFPEFDPEKPETMNCQNVGMLGFFTPPFDARPGGRPT
jgi:hypothetical protein